MTYIFQNNKFYKEVNLDDLSEKELRELLRDYLQNNSLTNSTTTLGHVVVGPQIPQYPKLQGSVL